MSDTPRDYHMRSAATVFFSAVIAIALFGLGIAIGYNLGKDARLPMEISKSVKE